MIGLTRKVRVFICLAATDMRKSYDTLAGLVHHEMGGDVLSGDLYLFVGRDLRRSKVLYFDGTGLCLFQKRLSSGRFSAPWEGADRAVMTQGELALFLDGSRQVGRVPRSPPALTEKDMFISPDAFT